MYSTTLFRNIAAYSSLAVLATPNADGSAVVGEAPGYYSKARNLIDFTKSNVFHLDLHARGSQRRRDSSSDTPWFEGFNGKNNGVSAAAATISHPIRRMLGILREEGVGLEEAMSWATGEGKSADSHTSYSQGYQIVDNYLVRVLAGKSAWELPPGGVGNEEFQTARTVLGKFEVLLRADCLAVDLPLLYPYLAGGGPAGWVEDVGSDDGFAETEGSFVPLGMLGHKLLRDNRWDLQLWDFAQKLVPSRSTTVESYLCGSSNAAKAQRMPGKGRRAVVYNSPAYHVTGVAMFSCVLMSLGFDVTAVIKEPGAGFEELLPCPRKVVSLINATIPGNPDAILTAEVSASLGLTPWPRAEGEDHTPDGAGWDDSGWRDLVESDLRERDDGGGGRLGPFDLSVLCTAVSDVNHLLKDTYPVDPRLVDALLWSVKASIWNLHSVEGAFKHDHRVPPRTTDFARGTPRASGGRRPPPTFLTTYGEHVAMWESWSEEAYEGWGWGARAEEGADSGGLDLELEIGNSSLGALFRRQGVVYPIHPTGHLRLPRPKLPFNEADNREEGGGVIFVVQGNMQSYRRDYGKLMRCLEEMCASGRANYTLVAVGARGGMPGEIRELPCVEARTSEWRHLGFAEFYANISAAHFVVTAAAGHDYEFDRATSSVPTALLLERPLVMSSTLLDAYPCLRHSRVHSMVANDDLCLNLQAAYDLNSAEYDEMELEARDCKLQMWQQARETVAAMSSGWALG